MVSGRIVPVILIFELKAAIFCKMMRDGCLWFVHSLIVFTVWKLNNRIIDDFYCKVKIKSNIYENNCEFILLF